MRRRTKVAIIGYTDHRALAPFSDDEWEIWGLNDLYFELGGVPPERVRWFQLHSWHEVAHWKRVPVNINPMNLSGGPPHPRDINHVAWLSHAANSIPVYLLEPRPEIPNARIFPLDLAMQEFSLDRHTPQRYFTNTISYMLALAIMEGFEEIGVYGVDMMMGGGPGSEYGYQRPSCEFFLGIAQGRGIAVHIPDESDLLKTAFLYGQHEGNALRKKLVSLREYYVQRRAECQNQAAAANAGNSELTGAINTIEHLLRSWLPGDSESGSLGRAPLPGFDADVREPGAPQLRQLGLVEAA